MVLLFAWSVLLCLVMDFCMDGIPASGRFAEHLVHCGPVPSSRPHAYMSQSALAVFRTRICEQHRQGQCRESDRCPHSHCQTWQRRNPNEYQYSPRLCPEIEFVKKGNKMTLVRRCSRGRGCMYAHSKEEELYHPSMYKTKLCNAQPCTRYFCPFAHATAELRKPPPATAVTSVVSSSVEVASSRTSHRNSSSGNVSLIAALLTQSTLDSVKHNRGVPQEDTSNPLRVVPRVDTLPTNETTSRARRSRGPCPGSPMSSSTTASSSLPSPALRASSPTHHGDHACLAARPLIASVETTSVAHTMQATESAGKSPLHKHFNNVRLSSESSVRSTPSGLPLSIASEVVPASYSLDAFSTFFTNNNEHNRGYATQRAVSDFLDASSTSCFTKHIDCEIMRNSCTRDKHWDRLDNFIAPPETPGDGLFAQTRELQQEAPSLFSIAMQSLPPVHTAVTETSSPVKMLFSDESYNITDWKSECVVHDMVMNDVASLLAPTPQPERELQSNDVTNLLDEMFPSVDLPIHQVISPRRRSLTQGTHPCTVSTLKEEKWDGSWQRDEKSVAAQLLTNALRYNCWEHDLKRKFERGVMCESTPDASWKSGFGHLDTASTSICSGAAQQAPLKPVMRRNGIEGGVVDYCGSRGLQNVTDFPSCISSNLDSFFNGGSNLFFSNGNWDTGLPKIPSSSSSMSQTANDPLMPMSAMTLLLGREAWGATQLSPHTADSVNEKHKNASQDSLSEKWARDDWPDKKYERSVETATGSPSTQLHQDALCNVVNRAERKDSFIVDTTAHHDIDAGDSKWSAPAETFCTVSSNENTATTRTIDTNHTAAGTPGSLLAHCITHRFSHVPILPSTTERDAHSNQNSASVNTMPNEGGFLDVPCEPNETALSGTQTSSSSSSSINEGLLADPSETLSATGTEDDLTTTIPAWAAPGGLADMLKCLEALHAASLTTTPIEDAKTKKYGNGAGRGGSVASTCSSDNGFTEVNQRVQTSFLTASVHENNKMGGAF